MPLTANDPKRTSWLHVPKNSDFPIQNIPFGVFLTRDDIITIGTRIGETAIDLGALHQLGYFKDIELTDDIFLQDTLNDFIADGRKTWRLVRNRISDLFLKGNDELRKNKEHCKEVLFRLDEIEMQLPVDVGDYTDFYASKEHATNVGSLFRDPENALLPNWLHIPIGYHGRSSSIIPSGTNIRRPIGQMKPGDDGKPGFGPTKLLDFELEMAFITTATNDLGKRVSIKDAEENIFGLVLFNDWSARDIQKWEYVPLGPFLAKNLATSISPWVVTMEALEPFRVPGPVQDPEPLPYLRTRDNWSYDINLEVHLNTPKMKESMIIAKSNYRYMYWNICQQVAHHTSNGCNLRVGDLLASGTISGSQEDSYGSLLELTWKGTKPLELPSGETRTFLQDHDTLKLTGWAEGDGYRIGFGEVSGQISPPVLDEHLLVER
ncbi:MAG: fumarylacetoacetase [Marinirhabdus sp.]|nr:fumarylacetoacetase [Marinirhabdus sp.]